MLNFFRKYQKFFFLITTIIIVMSFLFFGTYQAIAPAFHKKSEQESYTSQMARFLNTEYWMGSRKLFAANFLNDGVISKDFLETGMAETLVNAYPQFFQKDFEIRFEKEKSYTPYIHPFQPSISAYQVWSIFAPDIPIMLKVHQESKGGFKQRNDLFLAQKKFPPAFFSQIIRSQEQNNSFLPADPRLARENNSLFSYQDLTDWYGQNFVETISDSIIQTANLARKKEYKVSKDEILAELVSRSQEVYRSLKEKIDLPIKDGYELFQLYLSQIGMQEQQAIKIWEDVTLFRRLMHAVGEGGALIDVLPLSQFYAYAYENVLLEIIQMPAAVRLKSMEDLKLLEVYLAAVSEKRVSIFDIPLEYSSLETIEKQAPELVGRRYQLYYTHTSKKALQSKVTLKETLDWECAPENWPALQQQFPELMKKTGAAFDILENMEVKGRKLIDDFVRKQIVEMHPEWIESALVEKEMDEKEIFLNSHSAQSFEGIIDNVHLANALNAQDELLGYSQDNIHYYRFLIKERGKEKEILTYTEAFKSKMLDKLSERMQGETLLQSIVEATPSRYRTHAYAYRFANFITNYKEFSPEGELAKQFPIDKLERTITRAEPCFISVDEALNQTNGSFSEMHIDPVEGAYIYRLVQKKVDKSLPLDKLVKYRDLLSKEAQCRYFETLLNKYKFKSL